MQSGRANTRKWVLKPEPSSARWLDPLTGWTGSADMAQQVRLTFDSKEEAIAYAKKHGLDYTVQEPHRRKVRPKSYADNFRWQRPG